MRYTISGCLGFIGSNLMKRLLEDGHEVVGVDNLSTGRWENVEDIDGDFRTKIILGDLCRKEICEEAVDGADFVLHQAAHGSVPKSVEDPAKYFCNNVTSTVNMLLAARDAGVQRFVYASSASVYGNVPEGVLREDMPTDPCNPYAASKLMAEWAVRVFWRTYGLPTVSLRYFNVFGPRQASDGPYAAVVPAFIQAALAGEPATIYGDGGQARDFTHVDNVVAANLLACEAPETANGEAFNVAAGGFTSVNELRAVIAGMVGDDTPPEYVEPRAGDVQGCRSDILRARTVLGYEPAVGMEDGIRSTVGWYAENSKRT